MGTFKVQIEVGNPQGDRFEVVDALVDTGATYTVLPHSLLDNLGVHSHTSAPFVLADERRVDYEIGRTWIRINGEAEIVLVVFGDEGVEPLLGAFTLEAFRLAPNPINETLMSVPGLLKQLQPSDMMGGQGT